MAILINEEFIKVVFKSVIAILIYFNSIILRPLMTVHLD